MKKINMIVFLIAVFSFLAMHSPFIYGYLTQTEEKRFMGIHQINWPDTYTYHAWTQQARSGKILFSNLFTSENQKDLIFRPDYLVMGNFAILFKLSNIQVYFLFKFFGQILAIFAIYYLISKFYKDNEKRIITLLIVLFSSGIGWFVSSFWPKSVDLWLADANIFLNFSEHVSFPISIFLAMMIFAQIISRRSGLASNSLLFFWSLILGFIHIYHFFIIIAALILFQSHAFFSRKIKMFDFTNIVAIILGFLPSGLYFLWLSKTQPLFDLWISQDILPSPSLGYYILGFGFLIPLILIAVKIPLKKEEKHKWILIYFWVFASLLLLYSPIIYQMKFLEGVPIAIGILASRGYFHLLDKYFNRKETRRYLIIAFSLFVLSLSNIFVSAKDIAKFSKKLEPFYMNSSFLKSTDWLKENVSEGSVILSDLTSSLFIPGLSERKIFVAHPIQTVNFGQKNRFAYLAFANPQSLSQELLNDLGISHILLRDQYKNQKNVFAVLSFLRPVYENNGVIIFEVIN